MDAIGIETAVTSISAPGFPLNNTRLARRVARGCNDYAKKLTGDHPGRFGIFAAMPLPDVEGALAEVKYAFDVLGADGIGLLTSYNGVYPGDPHFAPFFDELERRKAVVFFHPTPCTCSAGVNVGVPASSIEYPQETTRTITSLLFSETLMRCPNVKFVFSHAGGTMPYIATRIARRQDPKAPDPIGQLKRLYYDVALSVNPVTVPALLKFAGPQRVVFGSDFPFASKAAVQTAAGTLAELAADERTFRRIARDNALSFLPTLKGRIGRG
ncbi:MAG: amidohydrolase family protein [Candidatus Solibacter sp.]|nr:amidohydrolase family protein [Candidatus Solibacter sp.]